jgi:long-subunit acyl-CoA synthetase (AMP-forming)
MVDFIATLRGYAERSPEARALRDERVTLNYARLLAEVDALADMLEGRCVGIYLDNGAAWAIADLAALSRGICCVPLPLFFSAGQLRHAVADAAIEWVITDRAQQLAALLRQDVGIEPVRVAGQTLQLLRISHASLAGAAPRVAKVTYTSGTTGTPKGVCLDSRAFLRVASSLRQAARARDNDNALSVLPLSTLLENIAGLYVPLLAGACAHLPPLAAVGLRGATQLEVPVFMAALQRYQPSTVILVPQMLQALVEACEAGLTPPASLRFIAVGGAPLAPALLQRARAHGLPVYEGYGLSEAASVVTLNRPGEERPGSVGRPLAHSRVRIAADGEILISGALFDGYLGEAQQAAPEEWASGDLGYVDADGFLYLTGRKKNMFITAFGRNVAPEWVEREFQAHSAVAQVAVFGEARPFNVAIVIPRGGATPAQLDEAVQAVNRQLPDYARIRKYLIGDTPFCMENGQLTASGRQRRGAIAAHYAEALQRLYSEVA